MRLPDGSAIGASSQYLRPIGVGSVETKDAFAGAIGAHELGDDGLDFGVDSRKQGDELGVSLHHVGRACGHGHRVDRLRGVALLQIDREHTLVFDSSPFGEPSFLVVPPLNSFVFSGSEKLLNR